MLFKINDNKCNVEIDKERCCTFICIDGITIALPIYTVVGVSRKHPDDEYNEGIGKALAYYRMKGEK